jgi:hypothetical protein
LNKGQKDIYARLIAEGVARLFQRNLAAAKDALDTAERWITARNRETARRWYLAGTGIVGAICLLGVSWLFFMDDSVLSEAEPFIAPTETLMLGAFVGGLSACLSVVSSSGKATLDIGAGKNMHYLEGILRVIAGMLGALVLILGVMSGLVEAIDTLSEVLLVCVAGGLSERLVPSFIDRIKPGIVGDS